VLYQLAGALNTACVMLGVFGIWLQLGKIWERRRESHPHPAEVLSLNNFTVSFAASWSFFVYGYSIEPFNHVLVWPRLASFLLILLVLYEIQRDRRTSAARALFSAAVLLAAAGIAGLALGLALEEARRFSQALIVVVTTALVQGNLHQIFLIWRSGKTGAVSLRMNQFFLTMDATGVLFGLAMGIASGWPLVLLSAASAVPKLVILWQFRWVRRNTSRDPAAVA
jgi:uncharacterized protein with PQ loop repeat